jgi:hypothetical protein
MAGYNIERDSAKMLKYLDHSRLVDIGNRHQYLSYRTATVEDLMAEFHWMRSRVTTTLEHLVSKELVAKAGFRLNLKFNGTDSTTYWLAGRERT